MSSDKQPRCHTAQQLYLTIFIRCCHGNHTHTEPQAVSRLKSVTSGSQQPENTSQIVEIFNYFQLNSPLSMLR